MTVWDPAAAWVAAEPWPGHDQPAGPVIRGDGVARVYARTLSTTAVTAHTRGESSVR